MSFISALMFESGPGMSMYAGNKQNHTDCRREDELVGGGLILVLLSILKNGYVAQLVRAQHS